MGKFFFITLSVIFFLLNPIVLTAQKYKDALYLKNGNIYRGTVIPSGNTDKIKIETLCGNLLLFNRNEIDTIKKEKYSLYSGYYRNNGYVFNIGGGLSVANKSNMHEELITSHFYQFNYHYLVGGGGSVKWTSEAYISLFGEFKYLISDKNTVPYVDFRSGISIPTEKEWKDENYFYYYYKIRNGGFFDASFGISFNSRSNHRFYIQTGYQLQYAKFIDIENRWTGEGYQEQEIVREEYYKRVYIRFGFELY